MRYAANGWRVDAVRIGWIGQRHRDRRHELPIADERQHRRIEHLLKAANDTPATGEATVQSLLALEQQMQELRLLLNGDRSKSRRAEPVRRSARGIFWLDRAHQTFLRDRGHQLTILVVDAAPVEAYLLGISNILSLDH